LFLLLYIILLNSFDILFLPVEVTPDDLFYLRFSLSITSQVRSLLFDFIHYSVLLLFVDFGELFVDTGFAFENNLTILNLLIQCFVEYVCRWPIIKLDLGDLAFIVRLRLLILQLPVTDLIPFSGKVNFKLLFLHDFLSFATVAHEVEKFMDVDLLPRLFSLFFSLLIFFVDGFRLNFFHRE